MAAPGEEEMRGREGGMVEGQPRCVTSEWDEERDGGGEMQRVGLSSVEEQLMCVFC